MRKVFIGLGSNLGDRVQNLIDARQQLGQLSYVLADKCSSLYVSSPVGYLEQPNFINCVLQLNLSDSCTMRTLFTDMQTIEIELGRKRDANNRNAARLIDIDLLLYDNESASEKDLVVPHPRISERLFVLEPLAELDPNILIADLGTVATVLDSGRRNDMFTDQILHRLG